MVKVVAAKDTEIKRMEKFHRELCHACQSYRSFQRAIQVDVGHIAFRAAQSGADIRHALSSPSVLASIIVGGKINLNTSQGRAPITIALEARLTDFRWVDHSAMKEVCESMVCVRVVVRQWRPKHIVVTVYRDDEIDPNNVPEVPNEIW